MFLCFNSFKRTAAIVLISATASVWTPLEFQTPKAAQAQPLPSEASVAASQWQEFRSTAGNFKVLMPSGTPSQHTVERPLGQFQQQLHQVMLPQEDGTVYVIVYSDIPVDPNQLSSTDVDQALDSAVDGMLDKVPNSQLLAEREISLNGFPGREVEMEGYNNIVFIKARVYLVQSRAYIVLVGSNTSETFPAESDRFFNSFTLLNPSGSKISVQPNLLRTLQKLNKID